MGQDGPGIDARRPITVEPAFPLIDEVRGAHHTDASQEGHSGWFVAQGGKGCRERRGRAVTRRHASCLATIVGLHRRAPTHDPHLGKSGGAVALPVVIREPPGYAPSTTAP